MRSVSATVSDLSTWNDSLSTPQCLELCVLIQIVGDGGRARRGELELEKGREV